MYLLVALFAAQAATAGTSVDNCREFFHLGASGGWQGDLFAEGPTCLHVDLRRDEFIRLHLRVDSGLVDLQLIEPDAPTVTRVIAFGGGLGPPKQLAFEAQVDGRHVLRLSGVQLGNASTVARGARVSVLDWQHPDLRRANRASIRADPRIEWLSRNAIPLQPLFDDPRGPKHIPRLDSLLEDARVVHLGASYFDAGADLLTLGRLTQYLVERLGFDVIVFESGIYDVHRTQVALDRGESGSAALDLGLWDFLARSRQLQELGRFVAASNVELAGFDFQFSSPTSSQSFVTDLRAALARSGIDDPMLTSSMSLSTAIQEWITSLDGGDESDEIDSEELAAALESLAKVLGAAVSPRDRIWYQIVRSMAARVRGFGFREEQMGRNLHWLVSELFPERRIVIIGMTYHMVDERRALPNASWVGPWPFTAGEWLSDRLEDAPYRIAVTSYQGSTRSASPFGRLDAVQPDLSPLTEFEELMAHTGSDAALVDLRQGRDAVGWTRGAFVTRVLDQLPLLSVWSEHLDALLFLRNQFPSESVAR